MPELPDRRLLIVMALLGVLLYAVRLELQFAPEPGDPPAPRVALADEMQIYEESLMTGSPYAVTAFEDVERSCHDLGSDSQVARACHMFDEAVHHTSDRHEIDAAADLLRSG